MNLAIKIGYYTLLCLLAGGILYYLFRLMTRYVTKEDRAIILKFIKASLYPALIIVLAVVLDRVMPLINQWLGIDFNAMLILRFAVIVAIGFLLMRLLTAIEQLVKRRILYLKEDNLRERTLLTRLNYLRKIAEIIIILMTIVALLFVVDSVRSVAYTVLASAGLLAAIIGFAAQKTLSALIAGFQVAFSQPIRVEDVVFVENEMAFVEEITMTYVVLRIWDKRRMIVPISYFIEKPFENWSRRTADLIGKIFLLVSYQIEVEDVRRHFDSLLEQHTLWDKKMKTLQAVDNNQHGIMLRLLISAKNAADMWNLQCDIREALIRYLKEKYPQPFPEIQIRVDHDKNKTLIAKS